MDQSIKPTNRPNREFTMFIINKLRDSKNGMSASNLCMAMKEKLADQFQPNKGEFNKWMKNLYNIEIDNSNRDMPFYKFKITDFKNFDKYKLSNDSYVRVLVDKIKSDHTLWSKNYHLYNTTQHNQITWDKLDAIFKSSIENVKMFDEKFPDFCKTIDRFRINKMPNKPISDGMIKNNVQQVPTQRVPIKQVPTQQVPIQQVPTQQVPIQQVPTQQVPTQQVPTQQVPIKQVPTQQILTQQIPTQQIPTQQIPTQQIPTQQIPTQVYGLPPGLPPPQRLITPPGLEQSYSHGLLSSGLTSFSSLNSQNVFEDLLGLRTNPNNKFIEMIKELNQAEMDFLYKVHSTLKFQGGGSLYRLIEEIAKVKHTQFS